jgi:hypothetical protein
LEEYGGNSVVDLRTGRPIASIILISYLKLTTVSDIQMYIFVIETIITMASRRQPARQYFINKNSKICDKPQARIKIFENLFSTPI